MNDKNALHDFKDAPIVVKWKVVRDALNYCMVHCFAARMEQVMHQYYSEDKFNKTHLEGEEQERMWRVGSTHTKDALGILLLVPGMKVIVTNNVAIKFNIMNGAEGILKDIKYEVDEFGRR